MIRTTDLFFVMQKEPRERRHPNAADADKMNFFEFIELYSFHTYLIDNPPQAYSRQEALLY